MALELPFGIKPVENLANIDERYGPYQSVEDALIGTQGTRVLGLTVGVIENSEVVEYWFSNGIEDVNLIKKLYNIYTHLDTLNTQKHTANQISMPIITTSTAFTLGDASGGQYIRFTGTTTRTIIVPNTIAIGRSTIIRQASTGYIILKGSTGVLLSGKIQTAGIHTEIKLTKVANNLFDLSGGVNPSYVEGFPSISNITFNSARIEVRSTLGGGNYYTYYVVLNAYDPVPSINNIIDFYFSNVLPEGRSGEMRLINSNKLYTKEIFGLSQESDYVVYVATLDSDDFPVIETGIPTEIAFSTTDSLNIITGTLSPSFGATGVSLLPTVSIQFDKNIKWGMGVPGVIRFRRMLDDVIVHTISTKQLGTSISGDILTLVLPSPGLQLYNTEFYVEITNDVIRSLDDTIIFPGITKAYGWTFTSTTTP